ncbi:MAG: hypothetical protein JWQ83_1156 [Lacunisphaera sp.]|nr:hypothetical protein [Lacunisphaera sp.]
MSTATAKSPADRQRACRERKRAAGAPLVSAFDKALRDALFAAYQAGDLTIAIPDVVRAATDRLTTDGLASERGCRTVVHALMARAGATEVRS